jgi:hypothetical protein
MSRRVSTSASVIFIATLAASPVPGATASAGKVEGSFVVAGKDAQLKHVRAKRVKLDEKGSTGYAVLLSARPATGDITRWELEDPTKSGSFVYVIFEKSGAVWVAHLAHAQAKSRNFGVVTELGKVAFEVRDQRLVAHVRTAGEQTFTDDRYSVDLRFEVPLEGP